MASKQQNPNLNRMPEGLVVFFHTFDECEIVVQPSEWPDDDDRVWLLLQEGTPFAVAGSQRAAVEKAVEITLGHGIWCLGPEAGWTIDTIAVGGTRSGRIVRAARTAGDQ